MPKRKINHSDRKFQTRKHSEMYEIAMLHVKLDLFLESKKGQEAKCNEHFINALDLAHYVQPSMCRSMEVRPLFFDLTSSDDIQEELKKHCLVMRVELSALVPDDNVFNEILADDLSRCQLIHRMSKEWAEIRAKHLRDCDLSVNTDKDTIFAWLDAMERINLHWVDCPLVTKLKKIIDALRLIRPQWDKFMTLYFNDWKLKQQAAKQQFGFKCKGDDYVNYEPLEHQLVQGWKSFQSSHVNELKAFREITISSNPSIMTVQRQINRFGTMSQCPACTKCKKRVWRSMMMYFRSLNRDKAYSPNGVTCRSCMGELLKSKFENEEGNNPFHGTGKKHYFLSWDENAPSLPMLQLHHFQYLAHATDKTVAELQALFLQDADTLIIDRIEDIKNRLAKELVEDSKEYERLNSEVSTLQYITSFCASVVVPKEKQNKVREMAQQCFEYVRQCRARFHIKQCNKFGKEALAHRKEKKYDEMYTALESLQREMQRLKANSTFKEELTGKFFDMPASEWINQILDRGFMIFEICIDTAQRCAICMEVKIGDDTDIVYAHPREFETESFLANKRILPCMACTGCFNKFLKHTSALGKPALKCPGMHCNKKLEEEDVFKIARLGVEEYRLALLKFKLKKCHNFKFCPRTDCAHGFAVKNSEACSSADAVDCPKCTTVFCPNCNADPHPGSTCMANQKEKHDAIWGAIKGEVFMKAESKQCPYCLVWIEKNGGCNHMTCEHCRGEFCWLCQGQWNGHTSCEQKLEVVRHPLGKILPWKRWPKPDVESLPLRRQVNVERQYHANLAYLNFLRGWGDEEEDNIDEIRVVNINPKYEGDDAVAVDNWELGIYADEWEEIIEDDWSIGTEKWIIVNRYLRRARIVELNDINQAKFTAFSHKYFVDTWLDKDSESVFHQKPGNMNENVYVTAVLETQARMQALAARSVPALPSPGPCFIPPTEPEPNAQEPKEVGGESIEEEEDDQKSMEEELDCAEISKAVEDEKQPSEPMYIIEWVPKAVDDAMTQMNYFAWIRGFDVEERIVTVEPIEIKERNADEQRSVTPPVLDEKAMGR